MKRNAKKELLAALEKELKACGLPGTEKTAEVFKFLEKGGKGKAPQKMSNFTQAMQLGITATISRALTEYVKAMNPKNETALDQALEQIRGSHLRVRPALTDIFKNFAALAPQKKRGPRSLLSDTEKQNICATVDSFKSNGMTLEHAFEVLAMDYSKPRPGQAQGRKISPRLVRKVWENHGLK